MSSWRRPGERPTPWALAGLLALLLLQLPLVPATNFGGFDEWMVLDLNSRDVVSVPYCHRPLNWMWSWPASRLATDGFGPFTALYGLYAGATALLTFGLLRRLVPGRPVLALLAGAFTLVWAPGDMARLSTVDRVLYSGETMAWLGAVALLVESFQLQRPAVLGAGLLAAGVAALSYEGTLPLLGAAPLLLLAMPERPRTLLRWALVWEGGLLVCGAHYAIETWRWGSVYQLSILATPRDPLSWLSRMGIQYAYHLFPLVGIPPRELRALAPWAAVAAYAAVLVLCRRWLEGEAAAAPGRRLLAGVVAAGVLAAGLGYSLILLGAAADSAFRLEILSGPGMAVALAGLVLLAGSAARGRMRIVVVSALACWVVAVGMARTVAMQSRWDRLSFQPRQTRMLAGLVAAVPDVLPHTLVVLIDDGRAWRATFGFHHAVQYLYERRASGVIWGAWDTLYPATFRSDGVYLDPWPVNREGWAERPELFRYDELIVARDDPSGAVDVLEAWPDALPGLPPGARYAPESRLRPGPLRRKSILGAAAETR